MFMLKGEEREGTPSASSLDWYYSNSFITGNNGSSSYVSWGELQKHFHEMFCVPVDLPYRWFFLMKCLSSPRVEHLELAPSN